jgi:hypothetical protein
LHAAIEEGYKTRKIQVPSCRYSHFTSNRVLDDSHVYLTLSLPSKIKILAYIQQAYVTLLHERFLIFCLQRVLEGVRNLQ